MEDAKRQEIVDRVLSESRVPRATILDEIRALENRADSLFPFRDEDDNPSYREHQKELIVESAVALWIGDYDNIVIDGPVGIGKSAVNYTLGLMARESFYTTPQKSLRNQLEDDPDLDQMMHTLKSRRDYTCGATGQNCSDCPINVRDDESCKTTEGCTYWKNKKMAMSEQIAGLTFAFLIVDNFIPSFDDGGDQISFDNRELLIVDECHSLESQTASLFAGFKISPWVLPRPVLRGFDDRISRLGDQDLSHRDFIGIVRDLADRAQRYADTHDGQEGYESEVEQCESFYQKWRYFKEEVDEGRNWVGDITETSHPDWSDDFPSLKIKPIRVDRFLKEFVWSRGKKRILSTATMPYRNHPERWFDRLGLGGRTHVISKPMPFPQENRPIVTGHEIDSFSGGGDFENWDTIVSRIKTISREHEGERGLIHTASYERAENLVDSLPVGMAMCHDSDLDATEMVEKWQTSNNQLLCSPSMMEGVDLKGDMARFQVLLKVPYPNGYQDSRVSWLLDNNEWDWYFQETGLKLWQSVGRAVRSRDDHATYYVLDESFEDVVSKTSPPSWIGESLNAGSINS